MLSNDYCRCQGVRNEVVCWERDDCWRYLDRTVSEPFMWLSFSACLSDDLSQPCQQRIADHYGVIL